MVCAWCFYSNSQCPAQTITRYQSFLSYHIKKIALLSSLSLINNIKTIEILYFKNQLKYLLVKILKNNRELFAGIVLKRLGYGVRIFERNATPVLENRGTEIVSGREIQPFLDKYGASKRPWAVMSKFRHYLTRDGGQVYRDDTVQETVSWDMLYYLLRAISDGLESEYREAPPAMEGERSANYEHGHTVTGIQDVNGSEVEVKYLDRDGIPQIKTVDLLIGADGSSSTIRSILLPEVKRKYVGYVARRGTVPEKQVSAAVRTACVEKMAFFHSNSLQMIVYTIPGKNGSLQVGERLINWVWYANYPENSEAYNELIIDNDGHRYRATMQRGKLRAAIWEQRKLFASTALPPQFVEVVDKISQPFVQSITDVISPQNAFFNGKVLLVGDATAGFRPYTGASTNQAAYDALKLDELRLGAVGEPDKRACGADLSTGCADGRGEPVWAAPI